MAFGRDRFQVIDVVFCYGDGRGDGCGDGGGDGGGDPSCWR